MARTKTPVCQCSCGCTDNPSSDKISAAFLVKDQPSSENNSFDCNSEIFQASKMTLVTAININVQADESSALIQARPVAKVMRKAPVNKTKAASKSTKQMESITIERLQAEKQAKEWKHEFYGQSWIITKENTRLRKLSNETKKRAEVGVQDDLKILIGEKRSIDEDEETQRPKKKTKTETVLPTTTQALRRSGRVAKRNAKALEIATRAELVAVDTTSKPYNPNPTENIKQQDVFEKTPDENESSIMVCVAETATSLDTNEFIMQIKQIQAIASRIHESDTAKSTASSSASPSIGTSTPLTPFTPSLSPDPRSTISYILNNNTHIVAPATMAGPAGSTKKANRMIRFRVTHNDNSPPWTYVTSERWEKIKAEAKTENAHSGNHGV